MLGGGRGGQGGEGLRSDAGFVQRQSSGLQTFIESSAYNTKETSRHSEAPHIPARQTFLKLVTREGIKGCTKSKPPALDLKTHLGNNISLKTHTVFKLTTSPSPRLTSAVEAHCEVDEQPATTFLSAPLGSRSGVYNILPPLDVRLQLPWSRPPAPR